MIRFFQSAQKAVPSLNTQFARDRVARSMPGETAALFSVRLGCMSL